MQIQHFRNATMVIEANNQVILVDPMMGPRGSMATFTLPKNCKPILKRITHCLITHQHADHLDKKGERFLRNFQTLIDDNF